jgi:hypothetical protein
VNRTVSRNGAAGPPCGHETLPVPSLANDLFGLNGSAYLSAATVPDDGASDALLGGEGLDWFFASAVGQDFIQKQRGDVVTLIA